MTPKHIRRIALVALFVAANVAVRVLAMDATTSAVPADAYEPASDAEIAAAFADADDVVRCVAADTASGCR